jgi:signal transduction histidine kinase
LVLLSIRPAAWFPVRAFCTGPLLMDRPDLDDETIAMDVARVGRIDAIPKILEVICRSTGMGFAAVARVTQDRWVACVVRDEISFGLAPGGELELESTICNEIRQTGEGVVIDQVLSDPRFQNHHTPARYGFQSYISMPIVHRGEFFGTLCAIDPNPAQLSTPEVRAKFELFAELIAFHLETQERLDQSEAALLDSRETSELRDQFIAVLGHDLRNPLASIDAGVRLVRKTPLTAEAGALLAVVQNSAWRMAGLIDNVLDFARGRLGGGVGIERRSDADLQAVLSQVVAELTLAQPDRQIRSDIMLSRPVAADARRIGQLLSNLLGNALTHGAPDAPVRVAATTSDGFFELAVSNAGVPIPEAAMRRLFQPFTRATVRPGQEGLGLGLYIASEIAKAHGGTLSVVSDDIETRFTFRMPTGD